MNAATQALRTFAMIALVAAATLGGAAFAPGEARAETRTLDIYFTHTKQRKKITFKRNGKYVKSGLRQLNRILRDHRRKEATKMDPKLFDLVWEIYKEAGGRKPIHVISGYRSPKTNAMLRRRGRKTARKSQHMRGKAIDWMIPGVKVSKLRAVAMRQHGGGVGYYRNSFIHTDTARVRHWPRMSRRQLAKVFPKGRTIHVPSNGKPLRGYKVALANLKKGLRYDGRRKRYKSDGNSKTLLARIFRRDDTNDEQETVEEVAPTKVEAKVPANRPAPAAPETVVAARGTDLFAADAKKARERAVELEAPTRIARAIVPALRPGTAAAPAPTLVAAVDPARPGVRPAAALSGTPAALESFSVAELRARRAAASTPAIAYASPDAAAPGEAAAEALAAGRPIVPAPVPAAERTLAPAAPATQLAMVEPTAPQRNIESLNARIRSSFAGRPARAQAGSEGRPPVSERLAAIQPAPLRRPSAPRIDEGIVTAALAPNRPTPAERAASVRELTEAVKRRLPAAPRFRQERKGGVTFVRLTGKDRAIPFQIGNLYGSSVKTWATARTTRRGLFATLRAPLYRKATNLPAPNAVYAVGFGKAKRQRTDSFSGSSMLKVSFQELASLSR